MRQVLPSLLKTPHRGQESSICESGKGDEGGTAQRGFSFVQVSFLEVKFSKTNSSHIDDFCPRRADSEEEGILIVAPQKVSARQRGKGSGDGPRYAADRDATFWRWPSMHRKSGRYPSWSLSGAERQVRGQPDELCDVFSTDFPLHDGLGHPSKAKPQVSSKQVGLF